VAPTRRSLTAYRRATAALAILGMAACTGRKPPATPPGPAAGVQTPAPTPRPGAELTVPPAPPATGEETVTLTGVVTFRQRIALTPEAVLQVDLRDVTRPDSGEPPLARQIIDKPGQVPIPFSLTCARVAIEPGRSYAVSAAITDRGQLQFVTETRVPVLSGGLPGPIEIVVVPVR